MRAKIGLLSERRWGNNNFLWVISPGHTKPMEGSKLWLNCREAWIKQFIYIQPTQLTNWEAKCAIPLWVTHMIHRSNKMLQQKSLRAASIEVLDNILNRESEICQWEEINHKLLESCQRAFNNLRKNINLSKAKVILQAGNSPMYATLNSRINKVRGWKFKVEKKLHKGRLRVTKEGPRPPKNLTNYGGILMPIEEMHLPPAGCLLKRIVVGLPRKDKTECKQLAFILDLDDTIALTEGYQWV